LIFSILTSLLTRDNTLLMPVITLLSFFNRLKTIVIVLLKVLTALISEIHN